MLSAAYVFADDTQSEAEAYVQPEDEIQIFVSPDGSDSNNGSYSAPLKTINAGISRGSSELGKADGKTYYTGEAPELLLVMNAADGTIIRAANG